eukprot:NODE_3650_length_748_cov_439.203147_g3065_i0.p1 GENE.NODE_3650_length_748_cov_439.203147_g3065_i0~~NODE_3650_length_748_cov_439.203147_g3065_i0.p1  ORF type:complete len:95 (-),score=37.05 NODE_3650_length_748_cov_439.203147_g3065_i0:111-395(-)
MDVVDKALGLGEKAQKAPSGVEYLSAKAAIEKNKVDAAAVLTYDQQLKELDNEHRRKLAGSWHALGFSRSNVLNHVQRNRSKLDNPRSAGFGYL